MDKLNKAEINTDIVQWLNRKTESSNHKVILLEGFIYMLIKLKRQGTARIDDEGLFHQRFWKSLDRTLNYNLYRSYKKRMPTSLYKFYFTISIQEGFIETTGKSAKITDKGLNFLRKSYYEQLDFLLNKIW